jgi:hypothetical protein
MARKEVTPIEVQKIVRKLVANMLGDHSVELDHQRSDPHFWHESSCDGCPATPAAVT